MKTDVTSFFWKTRKVNASSIFFFAAFFIVSRVLFAQTAGPTRTPPLNPVVTNISYSGFLNAKGATDPWHFYEATTLIFRSGSPGHYRYEVNPQAVKTPMQFLSEEDAAEYYQWKYAAQLLVESASQSYALILTSSGKMVSNIDPCLKSNALQIQIQNIPAPFPAPPDHSKKKENDINDTFFSTVALVGMGVVLGASLAEVGVRSCGRSSEVHEKRINPPSLRRPYTEHDSFLTFFTDEATKWTNKLADLHLNKNRLETSTQKDLYGKLESLYKTRLAADNTQKNLIKDYLQNPEPGSEEERQNLTRIALKYHTFNDEELLRLEEAFTNSMHPQPQSNRSSQNRFSETPEDYFENSPLGEFDYFIGQESSSRSSQKNFGVPAKTSH